MAESCAPGGPSSPPHAGRSGWPRPPRPRPGPRSPRPRPRYALPPPAPTCCITGDLPRGTQIGGLSVAGRWAPARRSRQVPGGLAGLAPSRDAPAARHFPLWAISAGSRIPGSAPCADHLHQASRKPLAQGCHGRPTSPDGSSPLPAGPAVGGSAAADRALAFAFGPGRGPATLGVSARCNEIYLFFI
jgi:hypothetical protein